MVSSSRGRGFGCCPELLKGPTSGHPRVTSDRHCEDIELPAQTVTYNERWRWQEPEVRLRRADVLLPYRASVHRWRNARPLPVRGRHELVSRGVRLMRHDALPWVLGCHSGWFLTNSGLWLTRCCPRSPRVRREEGPLRSTSGPCAGPWPTCGPVVVTAASTRDFRRLAGRRTSPVHRVDRDGTVAATALGRAGRARHPR